MFYSYTKFRSQAQIINLLYGLIIMKDCSLLNNALSVNYIASNEGMINEWWIEMYLEGGGRNIIKVLSQYLVKGTEEKHEP
jgi:hypothetical protein